MKKRRIKRSIIKKGMLLIVIIIAIIIIFNVISTIKYHKTDEYKLKKIGYNEEEINVLLESSENNLTYALNNEYNEYIDDFIKEKYYIENNLERYLNYQKEHSKKISETVSIVNVNADNEWYTNTKPSDLSKENLILVNKFNYLEEEYKIENIITITSRYAYSNNESNDEIMEYYKKMFNAAEKEGIDLIISSAFRDYEEQQETYEYYKNKKGEDYANNYAAKPGFSEHQTGLAFDILTTNANTSNFEETKEFTWLKENAYKYGFIMRYPEGKETITGYNYEPWHYRYVGMEVAKIIHDENITFDEYYAYYIENK